MGWIQQTGNDIHDQLTRLAAARVSARAIVRIAPRRWRLRATVDAELKHLEPLDLLANARAQPHTRQCRGIRRS